MSTHGPITSPRTYGLVFAALMALLVLTVVAALIPSTVANLVIALSIAVAKAVLIVLFFMNVRHAAATTRVYVIAGFVWLSILLGLLMADYLTRVKIEPLGGQAASREP